MSKRQSLFSPRTLAPRTCHGLRLPHALGLDGSVRNDKRDRFCSVAEDLAAGCAVRVASGLSRAPRGQNFLTIARGAGTIDRLSGWKAQVLRFAAGPLTRDKFSAEGLADSSRYLLRPSSILSMGGTSRGGRTVCSRCRQCSGGESHADRDSLPSHRGAGCVARWILRRLAY